MRHTDVLWIVEHAARELDVACAVRHLAATRHALSVEVVPQTRDLQRMSRRISAAVVATPHFYAAHLMRDVVPYWPRATYLDLAWEQVLAPATAPYKALRDDVARRHVLHHAWGPGFVPAFTDQGVPAEHVFVNGQPAYKLYDPPYRCYFASRAELARRHGLDPARRWVLFADNYGWAFRSERGFRKIVALGADPAVVARLRAYHTECFRQAMQWCARAVEDGATVVVRPRPATAETVLRQHLRGVLGPRLAGVRVIKSGSVREWILASDVVASSYSTTLLEAAIAGRAVVLAEPAPPPPELRADWYGRAPTARDAKAFVAACAEVAPESAAALGRWARERLLATGDPIVRLADHLARVVRGEVPSPPPVPAALLPSPRAAWFPAVRAAYVRGRRLWTRGLGAIDPARAHDAQEADDFTAAEVEDRTRAWADVLREQTARPAEAG
jgi:hypothetical protein